MQASTQFSNLRPLQEIRKCNMFGCKVQGTYPQLEFHLQTEHIFRPQSSMCQRCSRCNFIFFVEQKKLHDLFHHSDQSSFAQIMHTKLVRCKDCHIFVNHSSELIGHRKQKHFTKYYKLCEICEQYHCKSQFSRHRKTHELQKTNKRDSPQKRPLSRARTNKYTCTVCRKGIPTRHSQHRCGNPQNVLQNFISDTMQRSTLFNQHAIQQTQTLISVIEPVIENTQPNATSIVNTLPVHSLFSNWLMNESPYLVGNDKQSIYQLFKQLKHRKNIIIYGPSNSGKFNMAQFITNKIFDVVVTFDFNPAQPNKYKLFIQKMKSQKQTDRWGTPGIQSVLIMKGLHLVNPPMNMIVDQLNLIFDKVLFIFTCMDSQKKKTQLAQLQHTFYINIPRTIGMLQFDSPVLPLIYEMPVQSKQGLIKRSLDAFDQIVDLDRLQQWKSCKISLEYKLKGSPFNLKYLTLPILGGFVQSYFDGSQFEEESLLRYLMVNTPKFMDSAQLQMNEIVCILTMFIQESNRNQYVINTSLKEFFQSDRQRKHIYTNVVNKLNQFNAFTSISPRLEIDVRFMDDLLEYLDLLYRQLFVHHPPYGVYADKVHLVHQLIKNCNRKLGMKLTSIKDWEKQANIKYHRTHNGYDKEHVSLLPPPTPKYFQLRQSDLFQQPVYIKPKQSLPTIKQMIEQDSQVKPIDWPSDTQLEYYNSVLPQLNAGQFVKPPKGYDDWGLLSQCLFCHRVIEHDTIAEPCSKCTSIYHKKCKIQKQCINCSKQAPPLARKRNVDWHLSKFKVNTANMFKKPPPANQSSNQKYFESKKLFEGRFTLRCNRYADEFVFLPSFIHKNIKRLSPADNKILNKYYYQDGTVLPVYVKYVKGMGWGLFALRKIFKNQFVCWYAGDVYPQWYFYSQQNKEWTLLFMNGSSAANTFCVGQANTVSFGQILNYAASTDPRNNCNPSVVMNDNGLEIILMANRVVQQDQQLCWDYNAGGNGAYDVRGFV